MKSKLKLELKILLVFIVPFILFTTFLLVNSYRHTTESLLNEKKLATKALVGSAFGILDANYKYASEMKVCGEEDALKKSLKEIENLRYGDEAKDYFFVIDHNPTMLMHPYSKNLVGQSLVDYKDPEGKKLFVEMVDSVKQSGSGFVDYMWAWKGDNNNILPKVSYVREFKPWKIIIGTGIYVNDVKEEARKQIMSIILMSLLALFIIIAIIYIYVRRYISAPILLLAKNLNEISQQVLKTSYGVSTAGAKLAEVTTEQASSIEETSASLEELTGMVENNVKSAEESNLVSGEVREVTEKGNLAMQELVRSMDEIIANNENIQKFSDVIAQIADKTQIIDDIVFQTKLLSFNASVEAERAGEHGRGFAVVAQEVGNLAQMSGKAALEISGIVKESISKANETASENLRRVEIGNKLVRSTAEVLKEISAKSNLVSVASSQIMKASKEQEIGIKQINEAVGILDKAIQVNSSNSQESAENSQKLSDLVKDLDGTIGDLMLLVTGNAVISDVKIEGKSEFKARSATTPKSGNFAKENAQKGPSTLKKTESKDWDSL